MPDYIIERNFSKAASTYDEHAVVQRLAACELLKALPSRQYVKILEIGCGTGIYTRLLAERFASASIESLDISSAMIQVARAAVANSSVRFIVRDGQSIEERGSYDLITSNSAFQWLPSIEKSLEDYHDALEKEGILAFSIFGRDTFKELASAIEKSAGAKCSSIGSRNFLSKEILEKSVKKCFSSFSVVEMVFSEEYPSLEKLLRSIRYTGVRGRNSSAVFSWTKGLMEKTEKMYIEEYGRMIATYQVFICTAEK